MHMLIIVTLGILSGLALAAHQGSQSKTVRKTIRIVIWIVACTIAITCVDGLVVGYKAGKRIQEAEADARSAQYERELQEILDSVRP